MFDQLGTGSVDASSVRKQYTVVQNASVYMNTYRLIGRSNVGEGFVIPYLAA